MAAIRQVNWTFNVKAIAVIGAGTMGAGVAQLAATHGCTVHLNDVDGDVIQRGIDGIAGRLKRSVDKGRLKRGDRDAILGRIKPMSAICDLRDVELAIESVTEDLAAKQGVFGALDGALPASVVLATNTSSLSITRIAEAVKNPSRVVGMHFFNPAPVMPLVEVIAGRAGDEASVDFACKAAEGWGKVPVRAKDTPGFIVNRVARGFYLEALRLRGEGVAGVDEIDAVMRTHGKFKMGPFELMDLIGLDVNLAASTSIWEQMGKPARFRVHELQQQLVDHGHLGCKSGRGFYLHDGETPMPAVAVDRRSYELSPLLSDAMLAFSEKGGSARTSSNERYVFCRILGAIINEAGLLLSEDVATSKDIDVAMVKGANYPKGPLAWADDIGHRTVRGLLKALNSTVSDGRYEPAPLFADAM
jgi:3-hydroxybutyryl-CoA dehydrogenase